MKSVTSTIFVIFIVLPLMHLRSNIVAAADDIWFTPNLASTDMLQLFPIGSEQDRWPSARNLVKVFKFYRQHLIGNCEGGPGQCGQNILANFSGRDAFDRLKGWNIKIAFESGVVKGGDCSAVANTNAAKQAIANVLANSNNVSGVSYIAMDEPFAAARSSCNNQPVATTASFVKSFMNGVHGTYSVDIGLIEPYPFFTRVEIEARIDALISAAPNPPLKFFHIDVDMPAVGNVNLLKSDLQGLKNFCTARGLTFGVLFVGTGNSNATYYNSALSLINIVKQAIGTPAHSNFQSFATGFTVPINLGECNYFTHTRLVHDAYLLGKGSNSQFISQTVPSGPWTTGQIRQVTITMKNTGRTIWQDPDSFDATYFLSYSSAVDTSCSACPTNPGNRWGASPSIPVGTCVAPGQTKTFTFSVTAPATPSNYNFKWRMNVQDNLGTRSFGQTSTCLCRVVQ